MECMLEAYEWRDERERREDERVLPRLFTEGAAESVTPLICPCWPARRSARSKTFGCSRATSARSERIADWWSCLRRAISS